jgi:hypothetical protein
LDALATQKARGVVIGLHMGQIEKYSDNEAIDPSEVFSNKYPVGSKIYEIKDISIEEAVAVEYEGKYLRL